MQTLAAKVFSFNSFYFSYSFKRSVKCKFQNRCIISKIPCFPNYCQLNSWLMKCNESIAIFTFSALQICISSHEGIKLRPQQLLWTCIPVGSLEQRTASQVLASIPSAQFGDLVRSNSSFNPKYLLYLARKKKKNINKNIHLTKIPAERNTICDLVKELLG